MKAYHILLFPSIKGWFIIILSIIAADFSIAVGYKSFPSNVWMGRLSADNKLLVSLIPAEPPDTLAIISFNSFASFKEIIEPAYQINSSLY